MNAEFPASPKTSRDENFPVASFLLPKKIRPHVLAFYSFARTADDIADSESLTAAEKLTLLDGLEKALSGVDVQTLDEHLAAPARNLHQSLKQSGVSDIYARDLLAAFRQDATQTQIQTQIQTWDDLMAYCALSASPVGRYLMALSRGAQYEPDEDCLRASDALCAALQVLNHIQDIKADYQTLGRVYLPRQWLQSEGVDEVQLGADSASDGLRAVIAHTLSEVEALLISSRPLARMIADASLAREAAGIHALASRLLDQLKHRDPLSERVELSKFEMAWRFMLGALRR